MGSRAWGDFVPLLVERGPAVRIGGVLTGELVQGDEHWSLTARQEIHAELLPELDRLAEVLAFNAKTEGVIGQVRCSRPAHEEFGDVVLVAVWTRPPRQNVRASP